MRCSTHGYGWGLRMSERGIRRSSLDWALLLPTAVLLLWLLLALAAPLLALVDPTSQNVALALQGPQAEYPLGADQLGRSLWSRILYGARISLGLAGAVALVSVASGSALGLTAGYWGGRLDGLVVGVIDLFLALPGLVLALAIAGTMGPSLFNLGLAMFAVSWAGSARVVRSQALGLREAEHVLAARALGANHRWLVRRHILPLLGGTLLVLLSAELGSMVLSIGGLSFLGLGAQPPTPEWGAMLNDGRLHFANAPQLMLLPGLSMVSVVLAANLVGDALIARQSRVTRT